MADTLRCPNCSVDIEVSEVLCAQLRERIHREQEDDARQKEHALAKREAALGERERLLESQRHAIEQEVEQRLAEEKTQLLQLGEAKAREALALELGDRDAQLAETKKKLGAAQQAELQLRKERRELEAQKQELELAVNRRLDEERKQIRDEAKKEADDEGRLRDAERDKLITDLRRQIDDLKRKSEQGVPQAQGEAMELQLEDILRQLFPSDTIEPVPVSYHGGDVLQRVHDATGQECGTILWEAKRTRTWNDGWLPKLRDDQRTAKAHIAALATVEMPRGLSTLGCIDGVWVTSRACLAGLAAALRTCLLEVARAKRVLDGKQTKMELLYNYFSGPDFSHRIEGIAEAFSTLRQDLESEKRSMHRIWAKRERQLQRALVNAAGLHGDLGGLLDANLPQIPHLELASITANGDADEPAKAPWE